MSRPSLGRLWARYGEARAALAKSRLEGSERAIAERELKTLRDRLVINYSPLVRYVAGRVYARAVDPLEAEDVVSWGMFGLLEAIDTYDPGRRTKFESYAISKIRWAILDELRKLDPLSRQARRQAREVERARGSLAHRLGRSPSEPEVAQELGVAFAEHRAFLQQYARAQVRSLDARLGAPDGSGDELKELLADVAAVDPEAAAEASEVRSRLVRAIGELRPQERVVTTFYFYDGLTLREIGGTLGLTEGRISQILRQALTKLREALTGCPELTGRVEDPRQAPV